MGEINVLAVLLGALAFFAVGFVWYGMLFRKLWQRESGIVDPPVGGRVALTMGLTFAFELLIALMLGHLIARTTTQPHVMMMMAVGFAVGIMVPALGINYLHQRKSGLLFTIDAGHFVVGMAAMGAVFVAML